MVPQSADGRLAFGISGSPTAWSHRFYTGTAAPAYFYLHNGLTANVTPPAAVAGASGYFVRLRARDIRGYEYFDDVYYDNTVSGVPFVDNATMFAVWDNASLRLSWVKPAGLTQTAFPAAQFAVWIETRSGIDGNGDGYPDRLYVGSIAVNDAGGDTSITVPSNVYGYLAQYGPGDLRWHVQVRIYATAPDSIGSYEVYRHSSNSRVLPRRPNTVTGGFLQLRTNADGTREYVAWAGLDGPVGWNIPFDGGTVTSVSVLDNAGTPVALQAGSQRTFGGQFWQTVSGGSASAPAFGLTVLRGYNVKLDVPVGSLAAGAYTVRVESGSGTFDLPMFYPGDEVLPGVSPGTMSSTVNDDGSVTLSWQAPSGFDGTMNFGVHLRSDTQELFPDIGFDDVLYANVAYDPVGTSYSLTIPKYVADYARSSYAAGQVKWCVQTRKASFARTYSALAAFPY